MTARPHALVPECACGPARPFPVTRNLPNQTAWPALMWCLVVSLLVHVVAAAEPPVSFRNDVMPVLSKAGCNMGACHGNKNGNGMYPAKDPVRPEDLAATMFHLLGIDPTTEIKNHQNRSMPVAEGEVIAGVLA